METEDYFYDLFDLWLVTEGAAIVQLSNVWIPLFRAKKYDQAIRIDIEKNSPGICDYIFLWDTFLLISVNTHINRYVYCTLYRLFKLFIQIVYQQMVSEQENIILILYKVVLFLSEECYYNLKGILYYRRIPNLMRKSFAPSTLGTTFYLFRSELRHEMVGILTWHRLEIVHILCKNTSRSFV